MIEVLPDPEAARRWCRETRRAGRSLGFVPTMGALHEGHLSLVRRALAENDRVCVSIFVNPLQFDDPADLARYPRDLAGDARLLGAAGCHMTFTGTLEQFFPGQLDATGRLDPAQAVDPGPFAEGLEGELRPGHFAGVATIVARLFELVAPERAYFGRKDLQQCLVVEDLVRRRGGPRIVVCPTQREPSGLARSSRNELLGPEARARAARLFAALRVGEELWAGGLRDPALLRAGMLAALEGAGLELEYLELRDPTRWSAAAPTGPLERAVALVAARLGGVRLIDNHPLGGDPEGTGVDGP